METPKGIPAPAYPTKNDVLELQRIHDIKATGANVHGLNGKLHNMLQIITQANLEGWDKSKLEMYLTEKKEFYALLAK